MTENNRAFDEPKIQLILSIKEHDEKITFFLENNRYLAAAKSIHYLLNRLDISEDPTDDTIREIKKQINLNTWHKLTMDDLDFAHQEIHKFLNRTYYKGFSNNRPVTNNKSMGDIQRTVDLAKHRAGQ